MIVRVELLSLRIELILKYTYENKVSTMLEKVIAIKAHVNT